MYFLNFCFAYQKNLNWIPSIDCVINMHYIYISLCRYIYSIKEERTNLQQTFKEKYYTVQYKQEFVKPLQFLSWKDFMIICRDPLIWQVKLREIKKRELVGSTLEIQQSNQTELGWIWGFITTWQVA